MAKAVMCYITGKAAIAVMLILLFSLLFQQVFPLIISNSLHLWMLIKRRKFIHIILNSIIISILLSSSSFIPHLTNNLILKLRKKPNIIQKKSLSVSKQHSKQKVVSSSGSGFGDDTDMWRFLLFTQMDYDESEETATSFREEEEHRKGEDDAKRIISMVEDKEAAVKEEEEKEEDGLDATWKAIMESKGKDLKKSETWNCGDDHDHERKKEKGGLSKYRVKELKKWHSFKDMIGRDNSYCGGDGGSGGGAKRGWKSMEVALTFHDEFKKRADAFIAQFTRDIHLQRLESDQRFMEMINRGL